jgi:putative ABC transport system ATP-binding protein
MSNEATLLAEATDLSKQWADGAGLKPLSFTLSSGELVVVRGRSGSGKSTLLALLAGWIDPDGGRLERLGPWAGRHGADLEGHRRPSPSDRGDRRADDDRERGLAVAVVGIDAQRRTGARSVLQRLGLSDEVDRPASDTSLGTTTRMALARAAVIDPIVLLADEPTSHQDAGHIAAVLELLRAMVTAGSCIVVASHDHAVADVADRILDLDR